MGSIWRDYMRDPPRTAARRAAVPWVTWWLLGVHAGLWLLWAGTFGGSADAFHRFVRDRLLAAPVAVVDGLELWKPLTAVGFVDPAGPWQLLLLAAGLVVAGRHAERALGVRALLVRYAAAAVLGVVLSVVVLRAVDPTRPVGGPEGGLFFLVVVAAHAAHRDGRRPLRLSPWVWAIALAVLWGAASWVARESPIEPVAALAAGLCVAAATRGRSPAPAPPRTSGRPPAVAAPPEPERRVGQRVDELLAKIHAQGIGALTADERAFLEEASRSYR